MSLCMMLAGQGLCAAAASEGGSVPSQPALDRFNYVIGTQTIGASYQFTSESKLVETARAIMEMGSNSIKFAMSGKDAGGDRSISSLAALAEKDHSFKTVFEMPFAHYLIWTYAFGSSSWKDGFSETEQANEYIEIYSFTSHLLNTYRGSGKTFYLGHWEGDWMLRGIGNSNDEGRIMPESIKGMIDWLNTRQKAIDDAKRDNPGSDVRVWLYTEVNRVELSMKGMKTVANDVLPYTNVDYVSYSCYETQKNPEKLKTALDYIEKKLAPKNAFAGRRVFIGEYGFDTVKTGAEEQDRLSRQVMKAGLEWGCPMILYWEMYNNEVDKDGNQRGFWLINDKNERQPIYHTHRKFYQWAKDFRASFKASSGREASFDEFRKEAVLFLEKMD